MLSQLLLRLLCLLVAASALLPQRVHATLKFFYDPLTGNVSFDTSETRTGSIIAYGLTLGRDRSFDFRLDNLISLTNSTIYDKSPSGVGELTFGMPLTGLFTIGDILPPGLSEQTWSTLFSGGFYSHPVLGTHAYAERIGGGVPPLAEFIYGRPAGPFVNRELVDRDSIPWAKNASLIYNAATGELAIDSTGPAGGYTTGFHVRSPMILGTNFSISNSGGLTTELAPGAISIFSDLIEPRRISLGRVLPSGLDEAEFAGAITSANFWKRNFNSAGDLTLATDGTALQLSYVVPEPVSAGLAAAYAATAVAARKPGRRRSA